MSSAEPALARSYLYAPGSDAAVVEKALRAGADAVVLDLEDAVAPHRKDEARRTVRAAFDRWRPHAEAARGHAPDVYVRINREGDGWSDEDLAAVVHPTLDGIRLPKVESSDALARLDARLAELERGAALPPGRLRLTLTIESALGAVQLPHLLAASSRIHAAALGSSDLLADLGAAGDDDLATLHVRSEMVLHSRVAGLQPPIDSVHTDLRDDAGLEAASRRARALGFFGKSVIHPGQLATVHRVFTPSEEEVERARAVIARHEEGERSGRGGLAEAGRFVDPAIVARARAVLSIARTT